MAKLTRLDLVDRNMVSIVVQYLAEILPGIFWLAGNGPAVTRQPYNRSQSKRNPDPYTVFGSMSFTISDSFHCTTGVYNKNIFLWCDRNPLSIRWSLNFKTSYIILVQKSYQTRIEVFHAAKTVFKADQNWAPFSKPTLMEYCLLHQKSTLCPTLDRNCTY